MCGPHSNGEKYLILKCINYFDYYNAERMRYGPVPCVPDKKWMRLFIVVRDTVVCGSIAQMKKQGVLKNDD